MEEQERIYFRQSLQVDCTSIQLAQSYLDGRVDKDELFSYDGKQLTFEEVVSIDADIRKTIASKVEDVSELFPEKNKYSNSINRLELFNRIVVRGDDSLVPLFIELENNTAQIDKLQKDLVKEQTQSAYWEKNNADLVSICQNACQDLQQIGIVVDTQKRNLPADSDMFVRYSDIFSIMKKLTENIQIKLRNNIVAATVPDVATDRKLIETANAIDAFREETEHELARQKADFDAYVISTKQELDNLRHETNLKIKADLDALELYKKNEYQAIADAHNVLNNRNETCKKNIESLKADALNEIISCTDQLISMKTRCGVYEETIRSNVKNLFSGLSSNKHCFFPPDVPDKILFKAIKRSFWEVAPQSVLALYDCSSAKDGSTGILISTHAFYLFSNSSQKKYQLHRNNKITVVFKKNSWRTFWIVVGCFLILCWGVGLIIIALACRSCRGTFVVKYRENTVISLPGKDYDGFMKFCNALNQLCASISLTKEQIALMEKISL